MTEVDLDSWAAFGEQLQRLEDERLRNETRAKFLYRGQEDHCWRLLSTLERNEQERMSWMEYHRLISVVKPQIESFTGNNWNILSYPDGIRSWLNQNSTRIPHASRSSPEFHSTYGYMAYLRHYGFPSPMIDWSSSPYVAAYFAFRRPPPSTKKVSIYAFLESTSPIALKIGSNDKPRICRFGPYVETDARHSLQQSQYTICILLDSEWRYAPHEEVFARCQPEQDVLWKFNLPRSERLDVLRLLDSYNINAFSLFGTTESLMETLALREIDFADRDP